MYFYLVKFVLKGQIGAGVDKHNRLCDGLLQALSKPQVVHERLEKKQSRGLKPGNATITDLITGPAKVLATSRVGGVNALDTY